MADLREDIKGIADTFGYEDQSNQLIEEMAELTVAVNKLRRSRKRKDPDKLEIALDNVKEEIADVEIMLEQIKHLLAIPEEDIEAIKFYKINRTKERIAGK
jgi:NTP pyrophosphatase (non-canonical NTP hydrolase)